MLDYHECVRLVASARDKRSKPYANNTRVERRSDGSYALLFHATDVATFYEDGRIVLDSGGWRTMTTAQRIANVTRHVYSERGTWYVRAEPAESDPEPIRGERTIPKPFHALDPGPEPVRDDSVPEHIAGTETLETEVREVLIPEGEWQEGDVILEHREGYFSSRVRRNVTVATYWHEERYSYQYGANEPHTAYPDADEHKRIQCPHCAHHDRVHDAWDLAMHGERWGRNRGKGYEQMVELLDGFGTRQAWQDAYLDEFRAVREARSAHKAWVERNRVLFEDGMEITAEGYAKRPNLKEVARQAKELRAIAKRSDRINGFVKRAVAALANGEVAMPGSGDCWGCLMKPAEDRNAEVFGVDHLDEHIEEDYFVPSMFVNALRASGYRDAGIYIFLGMRPEEGTMGQNASTDLVARALRKYLYSKLIPEHAAR